MSETTAGKKGAIVALKEAGMSNGQVAGKENVAPSAVSRINEQYGPNHDFESKGHKKGRPSKLDEKDMRKAARMLSSGKAKNASDSKRKFFPHLHVDTL
ncbi:hypothetical protein C8F04DRAFT_947307 [Mycena alexandri]|uniref:Uncharacterized protein n=1 Tax=Mycena alexandri TaxID=1745969 RepID=A0AAD6X6Z6_9AGAR|nr:hypothetical protein C8F04DRAFT_947307 [Mycena alexandri]